MEKISPNSLLQTSILILEQEQKEKGRLLKVHLHNTYNSLKPINILKNAVSEIASSDHLKGNILNGIFSFVSGYVSKKIIVGKSDSKLRKIAGTIAQLGITRIASLNSTAIKSIGMFLFQKYKQRNSKKND